MINDAWLCSIENDTDLIYGTLAEMWNLEAASKSSAERSTGDFIPWIVSLFKFKIESSYYNNRFYRNKIFVYSYTKFLTEVATNASCIHCCRWCYRKYPSEICPWCNWRAERRSCRAPCWIRSWWMFRNHQWRWIHPAILSPSNVWAFWRKVPTYHR